MIPTALHIDARLLPMILVCCLLMLSEEITVSHASEEATSGNLAPKPLYRDPVYDGSADPTIVWNFAERKWFMFYTNRRANLPDDEIEGVSWVHGTKIGIAESNDGANWECRGTANISYGGEQVTYWAPEVVYGNGKYHMYLTVVPGVFADWRHPRSIVHLTSQDLVQWDYQSTLKLASDRVIDACVARLPDGTWRMWYNNEADSKSIYYADSSDLANWTDRGKVEMSGRQSGEGPKVFSWRDWYWMIVDVWDGLAVYRSQDATTWTRQENNLLQKPGIGKDDGVPGQHPDVVKVGRRAYLFYFTHPGRKNEEEQQANKGYEYRRSSIQVAKLEFAEDTLSCDRDATVHVNLRFRRRPRVHDPSTILNVDNRFWCFSTGVGVLSLYSDDLSEWHLGPRVMPEPPAWVHDVVPGHRGHFWAPDVIHWQDRYLLYYSVSAFGKRTSAIALASNPTLDPDKCDFEWTDNGIVIQTTEKSDFNAIDPSVFASSDGKLWMAFGSFWSGIKLIELDPQTGKRIAPDSPIHSLAHQEEIEAPTLHFRDGY